MGASVARVGDPTRGPFGSFCRCPASSGREALNRDVMRPTFSVRACPSCAPSNVGRASRNCQPRACTPISERRQRHHPPPNSRVPVVASTLLPSHLTRATCPWDARTDDHADAPVPGLPRRACSRTGLSASSVAKRSRPSRSQRPSTRMTWLRRPRASLRRPVLRCRHPRNPRHRPMGTTTGRSGSTNLQLRQSPTRRRPRRPRRRRTTSTTRYLPSHRTGTRPGLRRPTVRRVGTRRLRNRPVCTRSAPTPEPPIAGPVGPSQAEAPGWGAAIPPDMPPPPAQVPGEPWQGGGGDAPGAALEPVPGASGQWATGPAPVVPEVDDDPGPSGLDPVSWYDDSAPAAGSPRTPSQVSRRHRVRPSSATGPEGPRLRPVPQRPARPATPFDAGAIFRDEPDAAGTGTLQRQAPAGKGCHQLATGRRRLERPGRARRHAEGPTGPLPRSATVGVRDLGPRRRSVSSPTRHSNDGTTIRRTGRPTSRGRRPGFPIDAACPSSTRCR